MTRTAAHALVETLRLHGVDRVFCVPGESYVTVLDVFYDETDIDVVTCRHEGGAGFMAVADAKVTGRAGTCFVSRGPGAANAAIAVHAADQDTVPLVLFIGQVERKDMGRRAFQEVDYRKTFSDMAKSVEQVTDGDKLAEATARAYRLAEAGTPGPAVVVLPEDMLDDLTEAQAEGPRVAGLPAPSEEQLSSLSNLLSSAQRPVLIAGDRAASDEARRALLATSHAWSLPVATSFKRQDLFPNEHPNFAGHLGYGIPPELGAALRESDLIIAVGTHLDDTTSQGFSIPANGQTLAHIYPEPAQIGRNFATELGIVADAEPLLTAMAGRKAPPPPVGRAKWIHRLHQIYVDLLDWEPRDMDDGIDFGHIVDAMVELLDDDAIVTMDGGNFSSWLHRHFPFKATHLMIGCVTGAMGMGVPSAVAAALRHPGRQVVSLLGDGGMLMTGAELATAVQENANIVLVVSNNGGFGTIRGHQERKFPGRPVATSLSNPNFAAMAEAFGATGIRVETPEQAEPALEQALETSGPVLIEVMSSLETISAYTSIARLRGD
jgi:acetolactate synthase-1/2/3 large subunit